MTQAFDAITRPVPDINDPQTSRKFLVGEQATSATQRTLPYIVGPAIEVHVHGPFGLMAEALYTRAVYDYRWFVSISPSSGVASIDEKHAVSRWEFPILLKCQTRALHIGGAFVTAGVSIQYSRNYNTGSLLAHRGVAGGVFLVPWLRPSSRSTVAGPTVGVGWSSHVSRLRPSVEFRYTRWLNQPPPTVPGFYPQQPLAIHAEANQAQFLVGIMFLTRRTDRGAPPNVTARYSCCLPGSRRLRSGRRDSRRETRALTRSFWRFGPRIERPHALRRAGERARKAR